VANVVSGINLVLKNILINIVIAAYVKKKNQSKEG